MLPLVQMGRNSSTQQRLRGLWLIAVHYKAFRLRFFLLEEEREEDWTKPVLFPPYGMCKHVFAYWQPKLSHLQTHHVWKGKMPLGLWGKHFPNLRIRQPLLQFSSGFTLGSVRWLCSGQTLLSRLWTAIQQSVDLLPGRNFPFPLLPFLSAEVILLLSNIRCTQPSCYLAQKIVI